jgi:hypothetical protein
MSGIHTSKATTCAEIDITDFDFSSRPDGEDGVCPWCNAADTIQCKYDCRSLVCTVCCEHYHIVKTRISANSVLRRYLPGHDPSCLLIVFPRKTHIQ